jgi:type I restriction enzyme M protein
MVAKTRLQEFFDSVQEIAGPADLHSLALTVAHMVAAAHLVPFARGLAPGFLDTTRELTKADWLATVAVLAEDWEREGDNRSTNPFQNRFKDDPPFGPGGLERLRALILSHMLRNGPAKPAAPSWLLHGVLALTDPHDLFGRMSRGADSRLQDIVVEAAGATMKSRVFCAYDYLAGIAIELAQTGADVTLDVQQDDLATLCTCLGFAAKLKLHVRAGDPLELARDDNRIPLFKEASFDISIVFPPFGMRHSATRDGDFGTGLKVPLTIEGAGVALALARGRKTALCLLPPSFLFQTTKIDQVFKEQLIRTYGLDTIVGLPRGVLGGTSIAAALLVFKPTSAEYPRLKSRNVFMVDARQYWDHVANEKNRSLALAKLIEDHNPTDISLFVPVDDLEANDFNLTVERYVLDPEARRLREVTATQSTIALSEVAELYRPQAISSAKGEAGPEHLKVAEVGVADIDETGLVRSPGKQLILPAEAAPQTRRARLEAGDVLLVIKGSVGKVGFIRDIPEGETWLASQSFAILRLRQHAPLSHPEILFRFLSSSLGNASIQSMRVGVAVPGLQMNDVKRLMIVIPDLKTQAAIVEDIEDLFERQDRIRELRAELTRRQTDIWPERLGSSHREASGNELSRRKSKASGKIAS